jgi:hypothetical protein
VDISFSSGDIRRGHIYRRSPEADLALIDLPENSDLPAVPYADHADVGEGWHNPYRPSIAHAFLSGNVAAVPVQYRCEGGDAIEAMQLGCLQPLGDYAGYSGSPIERSDPDHRALLGILLEQYPEQYSDYQSPKRSSPVLFAATIAEVFRRFDCFHANHLLNFMLEPSRAAPIESAPDAMPTKDTTLEVLEIPERQGTPTGKSVESRIAVANALVDALDAWQKRGIMDEIYVTAMKLQVAQKLLSEGMRDNA